jgi:hypothetical protein
VFILDGFYKPNFHYTLQPAEIERIRWSYYPYKLVADEPIQADPAIFKKTVIASIKDTGKTIAKIYKDDFDLHMRPASNDIIQGIAKVTGYINGRPDVPHIVTGESNGPLLYVADDLSWIDDEFTNYYWKKNPLGVNMDEPMEHQQDHGMDTIKYLLTHCPEPSQIIIPNRAQVPKWMFWHEVD